MTYATIMINLQPGQSNAGLLRVAAGLAAKFGSAVVGVSLCQPIQVVYGASYIAGDVIQDERAQVEKELKAAEAEFHDAFLGHIGGLAWYSAVLFGSLSDHLAHQARCADLIVTAVTPSDFLDASRHVNIGDLAMQAGRPILIVPADDGPSDDDTSDYGMLKMDRVVIGWNDTREARRAISDALPLLKNAGHVTLVEIAPMQKLANAKVHLEEIADWLERHGVIAERFVTPSKGDDATLLNAILRERNADIIVAGAYGHNRMREWALGGVTRDLLLSAKHGVLISH